jgi:small basic protein
VEPPRRESGRSVHTAIILAVPIVALAATFLAVYGALKNVTVVAYADYGAVAIVAGLDSVCGGIRAGLERRFSVRVFITGFFTNMIIAMLFTYGSRVLAADLYLAVIVALGVRIFYNLGAIRHLTLDRRMTQPAGREEPVPAPLNPTEGRPEAGGR